MFQHTALSLEDAKRVAAAARAEAEKNGWAVVIAVLDDGGHLMYLERMDGTQKASGGSRGSERQKRARSSGEQGIEDTFRRAHGHMGLPGR